MTFESGRREFSINVLKATHLKEEEEEKKKKKKARWHKSFTADSQERVFHPTRCFIAFEGYSQITKLSFL